MLSVRPAPVPPGPRAQARAHTELGVHPGEMALDRARAPGAARDLAVRPSSCATGSATCDSTGVSSPVEGARPPMRASSVCARDAQTAPRRSSSASASPRVAPRRHVAQQHAAARSRRHQRASTIRWQCRGIVLHERAFEARDRAPDVALRRRGPARGSAGRRRALRTGRASPLRARSGRAPVRPRRAGRARSTPRPDRRRTAWRRARRSPRYAPKRRAARARSRSRRAARARGRASRAPHGRDTRPAFRPSPPPARAPARRSRARGRRHLCSRRRTAQGEEGMPRAPAAPPARRLTPSSACSRACSKRQSAASACPSNTRR